ncbi:MAG: GntR family transcriptional regulator [Bryobacteraceae bacterium]
MEKNFSKLPSITLRDRIADVMRKAILNGSLPEGSRIVERKLAAQFETSLTAVREALIRLEAEGFVDKKPNSSTYVTKLSMEVNEKIFEVRRVLETYAVGEAAKKATPETLKDLEKAYWDMIDSARNNDAENFILRDYALHEAIWAMTGNEFLAAALKRVTPPVFAFAAMRASKGHAFDLLQDANSHAPLLEAIKGRNPEAARACFLAALDQWLASTRSYVFGSE